MCISFTHSGTVLPDVLLAHGGGGAAADEHPLALVALRREHVAVELRDVTPRHPAAEVEPVDVLGHDELDLSIELQTKVS